MQQNAVRPSPLSGFFCSTDLCLDCDNVMASYAALQTDGRCDMACQGSATEICGGPNGIDIYKYGAITNSSSSSSVVSTSSSSTSTTVSSTSSSTSTSASSTPSAPGWYLTGCYVDSTTARTLSYAAGVPGGPANMTNEACTATCKAAGYTIAGTEYSQECCEYFYPVCEASL